MKNLIFVILAVLLNITVCVAQEEGSSTGGIGCMLQVSSDHQFIKVNRVFQGSPADVAGLKAGDHIIGIDGVSVRELGKSKLPPVIWSGSVSQASNTKSNLVDKSGDLFALLLYQFPTVWIPNSEYYLILHYTYTGIIYDLNDMRTVGDVIPGSPAANAGIQKGDEIINIFNSKVPDKYADAGKDQWTYLLHGNNNGLRYLFIMSNLKYKPYMQKDLKTVTFVIKHKGDRMRVSVTPRDRMYFSLVKN